MTTSDMHIVCDDWVLSLFMVTIIDDLYFHGGLRYLAIILDDSRVFKRAPVAVTKNKIVPFIHVHLTTTRARSTPPLSHTALYSLC